MLQIMLFGSYTYAFITLFPAFLVSYTLLVTYDFSINTIKPYCMNYALITIQKYTECSLLVQRICASNPMIEAAGNIACNIYLICHKTLYNYKIEPNTTLTGRKIDRWIHTVFNFNCGRGLARDFEETYECINDTRQPDTLYTLEHYKPDTLEVSGSVFKSNVTDKSIESEGHRRCPSEFKCLSVYYNTVNENKHIHYNNYLMIMKMNDTYIVHINLPRENGDTDENATTKPFCHPSKVSFLTIQYTHRRQSNPVSIILPKGMYTVGNELFSPLFVLRCLKYQSQPFHFDNNYCLKIIDNNIDLIELTSKQYIKLDRNTYTIHNLPIDDEELKW